jgi:hypothetical protein
MTILEHYLNAVRGYLPKGVDKSDVLAELGDHLRSKIEEREMQLGRALTESEQQAVLAALGDPLAVANAYGKVGPGIAFGRFRLIGPRAFPVYVGVLALILAINVVSFIVEVFVAPVPPWSELPRRLLSLLPVFVIVTVAFAGIEIFVERSRRADPTGAQGWLFWTPYLKYVPRWYSASGLIFLTTVTIAWAWWWGNWPQAPVALFGPPAEQLELSAAWSRFHLILLALLIIGIALRAVCLARPSLHWLPVPLRLVVNIVALALVLPILNSAPVVVADPSAAIATMDLATAIDRALRGLTRGFGLYWLFNVLWLAFVCFGYARHYSSARRRNGAGGRT